MKRIRIYSSVRRSTHVPGRARWDCRHAREAHRTQAPSKARRPGERRRGQKSSRWFTRGALWVVVPVEHLAEVAERLLPEAIAFAGSVTGRTSWMYAHSQDAVSYFARKSGTQLPNPKAG